MKTKYLFIAACLSLALNACVTMSPKKYKALISERDSLATRTGTLEDLEARLRTDTMRLKREIRELQGTYNALSENYNVLNDKYNTLNNSYNALNNSYNASSNKVSKLSGDLQQREARLKEVEDALRKHDEATNALKNKLQQALLGFQQNGLTVEVRNGKVYVSLADKLLFPSGSIIIDEHGKLALQQLAVVLNKEADINIAVEGHTDVKKVVNLGQIKDNWDLSVLRATSVCRYLTEVQNVDPHRITATGKSQYQPIDPGNTAESLAKNRRIEIVLTPKLDELYNLITK